MNKRIIMAIGIILVLTVLFGISYLQKNKQAINDETLLVDKNNSPCLDSDGGKNIYTKGSAVYKDSEGTTLHITGDSCAMKNENKQTENEANYIGGLPSCTGNNCYILEGYCGEYQGSPIDVKEFIQCQNGCNDGACISKQSKQDCGNAPPCIPLQSDHPDYLTDPCTKAVKTYTECRGNQAIKE